MPRVSGFTRRTILRQLFWTTAIALALPAAAGASEITRPIEELNAGLLEIMKLGKTTPFQKRYALLAPRVIAAFDLDFILQDAVGAAWASAPLAQQAELKAAFERYSVATYVRNFDEFTGERFELSPPSGSDTTVQVRIIPGPTGGEIHKLGYVMQGSADKWKAVDVVADGFISQGAVQKAAIRAVLTLKGFEGLIARLEQKADELSNGRYRRF